jgi:hypothetical protein
MGRTEHKNEMKRMLVEPTGSRKRVRFSTFSTLIMMNPRTSDEISAMWYTRRELAEFKRNGRLLLQLKRRIAVVV